jgi:hypothetical protein
VSAPASATAAVTARMRDVDIRNLGAVGWW